MQTLINVETGKVSLVNTLSGSSGGGGGGDTTAIEKELETLSNTVETLNNELSQLGEQVQNMQGDVNSLKITKKYDYENGTELTTGEDFSCPSDGIIIGYITQTNNQTAYEIKYGSSTGNIIAKHESGGNSDIGDTVTLVGAKNQVFNITYINYSFKFYPEVNNA